MLLRRLTEHVKTQNWTAIALDFLIVVLGVLLAFQISAWNESRRAEVVRAAAIERLLAESEKSVQYLRTSVARFEDSNAKRADLLNRLSQDDRQDAKTDQMIQGIVTMGRMPPVAPPRSAYDEIIASGLFAEIGDAKSRESVTAYFASVDYLNGMSEYMQTLSDWHSYWRSDSISEVFSPDEVFQTKTVLDVDALRKDEEFQAILVRGHRVQLALTDWWRGALSDAETMCLELARYSNRRCTVLQAPK